jgi:hypothetical protein
VLTEITEAEFVTSMFTGIEYYKEQMREIEHLSDKLVSFYNEYSLTKRFHDLKFYRDQDNVLHYEIKEKEPIGFKVHK